MNQFEKDLCSHYEKCGRFPLSIGSHHVQTTKSTLFTVIKDKWKTKEDTGKSRKNAWHVLRYAKSTSQAEVMSNSEKSSL